MLNQGYEDLLELNFWNFSFSANREHDRQCPFLRSRFSEAFTDKVHVYICFFCEAHSEEDVDGEARITNPAESVVPISEIVSMVSYSYRDGRYLPPPISSGIEKVGAAIIAPVGSYVRSFRSSKLLETTSRHRPLYLLLEIQLNQ